MFKKIKNRTYLFIFFYFLTLVFSGTFLILTNISKIDFTQHNIDFKKNEKKEFVYNYKPYHNNNFQHYSSSKNSLVNYDQQLELTKKPDVKKLLTLPSDLYSIKDIKIKKQKFIKSLLPIIITENQKNLFDRSRILKIQDFLNLNKTLSKKDQRFIEKIATKYLIKTTNRHKVDIINDLLEHVDIIPNSIVLAQAANESGWGSSRFARDFNALFGQYTYDNKKGIEPFYRKEGDKYLIKFFPSINHSIESYFHNLNTHPAYYDFRQTRKYLRENNQILDPNILSTKLNNYAKDQNYIDKIISIIKLNKLIEYDSLLTLETSS